MNITKSHTEQTYLPLQTWGASVGKYGEYVKNRTGEPRKQMFVSCLTLGDVDAPKPTGS